jgi:hypothetical protein
MSLTVGAAGLLATQADVITVTQPLVAGANVITHNLGFSGVEVTVRNALTGSLISASLTAFGLNTVTVDVPVAVVSARITIDA